MKTVDLRKQHRALYQASSKTAELIEVQDLPFLTVDGCIEPGAAPGNSPAFAAAVQALYASAYTLKFSFKKRRTGAVDWPVMPLEAIWWVEGGEFDISRPDDWSWRAMILQPDQVTAEALDEAVTQVRKKKPSPALEQLRLLRFEEGLCVQMLHLGPYATEPATVERMRAFAREQGLVERHEVVKGRAGLEVRDLHEIYLSDPRRTAPAKLKTLIRHPVKRVDPARTRSRT
jgi:hypothetical protein